MCDIRYEETLSEGAPACKADTIAACVAVWIEHCGVVYADVDLVAADLVQA